MNRFRSDSRRPHLPDIQSSPEGTSQQALISDSSDSLLSPFDLPPVSDFRTSLILPDLSRRFSLLRSSSGEPLSLETLRSRIAEHRARREQNFILEDEEDMILETLQRIRSKTHSVAQSAENIPPPSPEPSNSISSSPSGRSPRRYSNNLFGSSRHKESSYLRSVARRKGSTTASQISTASSNIFSDVHTPNSARPATADSLPVNATSANWSAPLTFPEPYGRPEPSPHRPYSEKRVSVALEGVIKELEEEDEQIVMPRSPLKNGDRAMDIIPQEEDMYSAMAMSPDTTEFDFDRRRASPIPARTVPGYVPGMARPMTPRTDSEERSTPRPASPSSTTSPHTSIASPIPHDTAISPSFHRSMSPSPLFLHRGLNPGRFTPDSTPDRSNTASPAFDNPNHHHRPSISQSSSSFNASNRPITPSKLGWGRQSHSRSASWVSDSESQNGHNDSSRSLRSPPLPDSPLEPTHPPHAFSGTTKDPFSFPESTSSPYGFDNQVTPTASPAPFAPSPVTPTATIEHKHTSYQSSLSPSPLTQQNFNPFVFSPIPNSSRSSLESTGSSYHSESGDNEDIVTPLFHGNGSLQGSWHDLSILDHSPSHTSILSENQAEEIVGRHGLKVADFFAIQQKLVTVAFTKLSAPDAVERVGSLRRRRPSTSQSITGRDFRIASPPPRAMSPLNPAPNQETISRATALLQLVVENSPAPPVACDPIRSPHNHSGPNRDLSPDTQRNRDLAQMIFGAPESESQDSSAPHTTDEYPSKGWKQGGLSDPSSSPFSSPASNTRKIHQSAAELERQVLHKNHAAMLALRKSPSNSNLPGLAASAIGSISRKKITPQQISTPTLVSASASVDTIPLPISNSSPSVSKFGSKLKRLRGTLRTKTNASMSEEAPHSTHDTASPSPSQVATYDPTRLHVAGEHPILSATEPGRFKVLVPSPPASAGPGLKGFMARFRGNKRSADLSFDDDTFASSATSPSETPKASQVSFGPQPHLESASQQTRLFSPPQSPQRQEPVSDVHDIQAGKIKQFFKVGSDLGVDEDTLNELLSRSASTSTQGTRWSRPMRNDPGSTPVIHPSQAVDVSPSSLRRLPIAENLPTQDHIRPPRAGEDNAGGPPVVLRRTLIFPSESRTSLGDNPSSLIKRATSQRKRASMQSHSSRSIHDRAPTPPPPRRSLDQYSGPSPPVPQLPSSLLHNSDSVAPQTSNSTYDSFYDAYTGDPKPPGDGAKSLEEPGAALEVIELANGETIWSIVNGLRDDHDSYTSRTSFASDYSSREDVQVYFKEHAKHNSKASQGSFTSHRKAQEPPRPDTKVFYSSPERIGKIIENLSNGIDAGSFNILPQKPEHSVASSLSSWTMEDRLEHMLGSLNEGH